MQACRLRSHTVDVTPPQAAKKIMAGVAEQQTEWRNRGGMAEWRNGGMAEWQNGEMVIELRNGGMVIEWRNGRMAEWRNRRNGGMAEW